MKYREIQQDLFKEDDSEYHYAQCISTDCNMDAGIAVTFRKKYKLDSSLLKLDYSVRKYPTCIKIKGTPVFNLITKEKAFHIPRYDSIRESLVKMRDQAHQEGITKIAMPRIGSGLDKKKWEKVREIIQDVFKDTNIEILVCYL